MGRTYTKEFRTGDTNEQCPNCGYYQVVSVDHFEIEVQEVPYSGWKFWKDTTTKHVEQGYSEGLHCLECGWNDYE